MEKLQPTTLCLNFNYLLQRTSIIELNKKAILVQIKNDFSFTYLWLDEIYEEVDDQYSGSEDATFIFRHFTIGSHMSQRGLEELWNQNFIGISVPHHGFISKLYELIYAANNENK